MRAMIFLDSVSSSPRIMKVFSDDVLERHAEQLLLKYEDQDFSYTDAVSFSVMAQLDMQEAFSFDHHFITAGYKLTP